jgi:hypothetical protein
MTDLVREQELPKPIVPLARSELLFAFDLGCLNDIVSGQLTQFLLRVGVAYSVGVLQTFVGLIAQIDGTVGHWATPSLGYTRTKLRYPLDQYRTLGRVTFGLGGDRKRQFKALWATLRAGLAEEEDIARVQEMRR